MAIALEADAVLAIPRLGGKLPDDRVDTPRDVEIHGTWEEVNLLPHRELVMDHRTLPG